LGNAETFARGERVIATNPLTPQGSLNRLRANVVWNSNPSLNVTASFLAKAGISLGLEGESVVYIPTLTGAVTSPEPYMNITMVMALLKSQSLSNAYKSQLEANAILGDGVVYPDTTTLGPYLLTNCSIKSIGEQSFAGEEAAYLVRIGGYYLVNSNIWNF
jgi:hypothetical protein